MDLIHPAVLLNNLNIYLIDASKINPSEHHGLQEMYNYWGQTDRIVTYRQDGLNYITFLQQPVIVINVLQLAAYFFHFGVYGAKPLQQHHLMSSMYLFK